MRKGLRVVRRRNFLFAAFGLAGLLAAGGIDGSSTLLAVATEAGAASTPVPATAGRPAARRLNEQQYMRSIHDIFGRDTKVPGRFEPSVREGGLLAIGDSTVGVSSSGFEQYELRAREIAAQVLAEPRRKTSVPCVPTSPTEFDNACAGQFVGKYGRLLYRRPLRDSELASIISVASAGTVKSGDFYKGLHLALTRLLVSPNFIFRIEQLEPDREHPGQLRLTDYSLATRISFLLWDAPPDSELLDAVAAGDLRTKQGLAKQVDRMIAESRFEQGIRSFFSDMFGYEQLDVVSKDQAIFPIYTSQLAKDSREQALRTIVDLLVTERRDYRDLFTTRKTFMNRNLGGLYNVPVSASAVEGWAPHTFNDEERRAGLLTLAAFLMLDTTHEGRTSPTIRGKSVRELFLCQTVPLPPGNVDFALVQDVQNPQFKTARGRLTEHRENPVCAGCHALTDPIGLSMENYDAIGRFRTQENGAPIDASGSFEGKSYKDLIELQKLLLDSPTAPNCAAQRVYEYGVGRSILPSESEWLEQLTQSFARSRYVFPALMREVAVSEAFQSVSAQAFAFNGEASNAKVDTAKSP